jgi:phosphatidylserine/phosphatidylglycerophosphate/cardiolipin synthase-like enzyme
MENRGMGAARRPGWRAAAIAIALAAAALAGWQAHGAADRPTPAQVATAPIAASPSVPAAAEVHYAPDEDLERIDVALIGEAGETIDFDAYVLTDVAVIDALREAAADRGVRERVYRNLDAYEPGAATAAALAALKATPGVEIRVKPPGALMHLKSYCVDGRTLRTGAANFSYSGEHAQDNDLVVVRSAAACAGFVAKFARDWAAAR